MSAPEETAAPALGEPAGSPPGRTVPAAALIIAVMVAAALGILAVVALTVDGGDDGDDGEFGGQGGAALEDARFAAGRFAERFLSFDDEALDEWRSDVLSLSTGGFAEEVEEVEEGLRRLIAEAELDADAQVTDIFIGDIDRGAVEAVVVYDRQLRSSSGTREENDRYMQLALLRVEGEWLVDNVIDIATAGASDAPSPPVSEEPSTTSTSAG